MKCQICNKNNATIHFTKIINGHVEERHLCESCAKENHEIEFDFNLTFPFQKIFTGLIEPVKEDVEVKDITCRCGLSHRKLLETGRFGCAYCYDTFKDDIESLIKGIHGHNRHEGKIPNGIGDKIINKKIMESLKQELQEAILLENYEQAAIIRDEINELKIQIEQIEG